jgi:hypothetical protein
MTDPAAPRGIEALDVPTASTDLVDPKGKVWHQSDRHTRDGEPLFYIDGAPATCPALVMSTEAELAGLFGAPMTHGGAQLAEAAHLRECYRAEYAHLLHDADPDSTVPAFAVSLAKSPMAVAR